VQCVADIRRALGAARDRLHTAPRSGYRLDLDPAAPRRARAPLLAGFALALAGVLALGIWQLGERPAPSSPRPVVAVLPFENLAGGERWDRLARGVTEEVIADLASNPWLFVLADATTRPHAGETPRAVGAALGAGHVVTGTLQADGGRVRIAAALADPGSGRQLWARQWEGPADDLLVLQTAAAEALVGELAGHWSGAIAAADRARAHEASTASLDAYDLYLLGIEHKHRMTPRDFDLAEDYLLRAVAIDPDFAKAWVGLSIVMGFKASSTTDGREGRGAHGPAPRLYRARRRGRPRRPLGVAPGRLGGVHRRRPRGGRPRDPPRGRAGPERRGRAGGGGVVGPGAGGISADANAWADRAFALNPAAPGWYLLAKGTAAFGAGDYGAAVAAFQAAPPGFAERLFFLAAAQAMLGDDEAARAAADELRAMLPGFELDRYLLTWPAPGLQQRLREGAVRAGLGAAPLASGG
jgi:TolB-like protein